jgi:methylmalonyl-CoA mutase C-terminal domain/subunit
MEGMKAKGMDDVLVMGGGIIPQEDVPGLKACGIKEVFGPGTETKAIIKYVQDNLN